MGCNDSVIHFGSKFIFRTLFGELKHESDFPSLPENFKQAVVVVVISVDVLTENCHSSNQVKTCNHE